MGDIQHARKQKARKDALMDDVRNGAITIAQALSKDLTAISRVPLWTVLTTARGMGPSGAEKVCMKSGVWPQTLIGNMSDLQRQQVIDALPKRVL